MSRTAMAGHEAIAEAMRQINPDVVAAYPITPQTDVVQTFSEFVADGVLDTEFVTVESEHSAMSACVGAEAAGARTMSATSANGLALMWEVLYIAASSRLPIVMTVVSRALSAPINIHCDHSDAMGARDAGWIQLFSENVQEAYDNLLQAMRIAEHADVRLPVMVMMDGFITSHAVEVLETLSDDAVSDFVGPHEAKHSLLDPDHPVTLGPLDLYDYYFEHKRQQVDAVWNAADAVREVGEQYGELSGRSYGPFDAYRLDDAEVAIVVLGSAAGTAKVAADRLRSNDDINAGVVKVRAFRPFFAEELAGYLRNVRAVLVMDRSEGFSGCGGPVYAECRSALFDAGSTPNVVNGVYGLGGRDIRPGQIEDTVKSILAELDEQDRIENPLRYIGVRE